MSLEMKLGILITVLLAGLCAASTGLIACMDDEWCDRTVLRTEP